MQIAVIEFARNVARIPEANSGEFDETCPHKVIDFMPGQSDEVDEGWHPAAWGLSVHHQTGNDFGAMLCLCPNQ